MDHSLITRFGPFTFDRARRVLKRGDQPIPIGGRGAAILAALVDAGGDVVTRDDLLDAVWPGRPVEERNLTVQIALLRKAMGDLPEGLDPIRTVPRLGYRLALDPQRPRILDLRPTVAVRPFANLSGDDGFAFFADGVTEDVIAALSRFRTFAVIASGSSFACGTRGMAAPEAAGALGVRYVLDGSVRREGWRLRVAVQLSDETGAVLWADRIEDDLGGVFEMQDRIVAAVVAVAEPTITCAEIERSRRKHPESLDGYDHFLQGVALIGHQDATSALCDAMVYHLDRAAALDPSFPQALACAGWAHEIRRTYGGTSGEADDFAIAAERCDRALAEAPDDPLVLAIGALERHNLHDDGATGLALADRALALNPHSYLVVDLAATVLLQRGRIDRAIGLLERCLRLSPLPPHSALSMDAIATCHLGAGRYGDAVEWGARALAAQASFDSALVTMTVAQAMNGQMAEARATLGRFLAIRPGASLQALLGRLPPGTRNAVEPLWSEGLRRAGLPAA